MTPNEMYALAKKNQNVNWIQRLLNAGNSPVIENQDGGYSTHRMMNADNKVFPSIVQDLWTQRLKQLNPRDAYNYAMENNEYIQTDTPEQAGDFAKNYKDIWSLPLMQRPRR